MDNSKDLPQHAWIKLVQEDEEFQLTIFTQIADILSDEIMWPEKVPKINRLFNDLISHKFNYPHFPEYDKIFTGFAGVIEEHPQN